MPKITLIEASGAEHVIDAAVGQSLMHAAVKHDVPGIVAECMGMCLCSTCHCYVDPAWAAIVGPRNGTEDATIDYAIDVRENSRLSCQIEVTAEMDGLVVRLPSEQTSMR